MDRVSGFSVLRSARTSDRCIGFCPSVFTHLSRTVTGKRGMGC